MTFQNLTSKGGNGGDGISGTGGGMGAGGPFMRLKPFKMVWILRSPVKRIDQQLLCYWWKWRLSLSSSGNEGDGGGGGFSGDGDSIATTGSYYLISSH